MRNGLIAVLLLLASWHSPPAWCEALQMAVTIDDLPLNRAGEAPLSVQRSITLKLLQALAERGIPAVGFVNEMRLYEGNTLVDGQVDLLRLWLAAGQELGNHTFSHPDLHKVPLDAFQQDLLRGERVTRPLLEASGRPLRYFRHPFLHTGRDLETRDAMARFLGEHGYTVAPVTIDNSEWIFARAYDIAAARGDEALRQRIGSDYVAYMLDMTRYYEGQAQALFGRAIRQVLLIHANPINADWLGTLADRLSQRGYEFISLEAALEDPAYQSEDRYAGPGGITWIHRWAITREVDPRMFAGEPEAPGYVLELTTLREHAYEDEAPATE